MLDYPSSLIFSSILDSRLTNGCPRLASSLSGRRGMRSLEPYWGRRALDFVDAIEASTSRASVISQFERIIGDLGFHGYIMAGIPERGQSLAPTTGAQGRPPGWVELYKRQNLCAPRPRPRPLPYM